METAPPTFWISNISNMDVHLGDLGVVVPARKSINLLDRRHYSFTATEIVQSLETGSLFKRQDKIKVRKIPPPIEKKYIPVVDYNATVPSRRRSTVDAKEIKYEELELSDEEFASQIADIPETDKYTKGK